MNCFSCFSSNKRKTRDDRRQSPLPRSRSHREPSPLRHRTQPPAHYHPRPEHHRKPASETASCTNNASENEAVGANNIKAQTFTFRELASATKNFRQQNLIGEGGFGRVYKGSLDKSDQGQPAQTVAIKQLDRNGLQGNREFLVEVLMLSLLHHPNLVNLIGYCADGEQRLLVYEYMALGSLEDHLLDLPPGRAPLPWARRMKIALHAAKGLEYLHDKASPPVIYRDLKSSNILLDGEYNAKLSDFGLAKLGPVGDKTHVSTRVMGTYGYCAPEYQRTGQLTVKSDVYSFGVVMLEMITGKRAVDTRRRHEVQNLVTWAEPIFKDNGRYHELRDSLLHEEIPKKSFNQAVAIAAMCLQQDADTRPYMSDVVTALSCLWIEPDDGNNNYNNNGSGRSLASSSSAASSLGAAESSDGQYQSEIAAKERERAVAEAIEWGSRSRNNSEV